MPPLISLIVPTRERPEQLRRMLNSVADTAYHPERIEVVLVVDADDLASCVTHPRLSIRHAILPRGRTMGELNNAGYAASSGRYVMLLNDDVILRTPGWDATAVACFASFPDPFVLVHVNDTLMRDNLCTFPLASRAFYEVIGGICPSEYQRYRIDDHIEDVFNLLAVLGERRVVYLPDVIFEHDNAVQHPEAGAVYQSDPTVLALDAPRFDALFPARKELALLVYAAIDGRTDTGALRAKLDEVRSSFDLREPGRQLVVRTPWWRAAQDRAREFTAALKRGLRKDRRGLLRALRKRLAAARLMLTPRTAAD